jgi:hypothetical protein
MDAVENHPTIAMLLCFAYPKKSYPLRLKKRISNLLYRGTKVDSKWLNGRGNEWIDAKSREREVVRRKGEIEQTF